jgi:hypothetical protein
LIDSQRQFIEPKLDDEVDDFFEDDPLDLNSNSLLNFSDSKKEQIKIIVAEDRLINMEILKNHL